MPCYLEGHLLIFIQSLSYPIIVQCAKYLLCILSRLTAHRSIAEMPLKLMKSDQTAWTFINKLSNAKKTKNQQQ